MNTARPLRRALRALMPGAPTQRRRLLVQHLGFASDDLDTLPAVLDDVGRELGVELRLDRARGDLVLAEESFVARVAPQVLHAFLEERPLLTIERPLANDGDTRRRGRQLHAELVRLLQDMAESRDPDTPPQAVDPAAPDSGFDSGFDSRLQAAQLPGADLDPDRADLLNRLRRGLVDPSQPPLAAGYGRGAALRIDFASGVALLDELADQRLRISRELPYLAGVATPEAGAKTRDLDLVVWDIALAAGGFRLLHSPVGWWRTPLVVRARIDLTRYTRQPRHLEIARCLAQGPISPADLRRRCRLSLLDLRGFLQAALFLGLVHWVSDGPG
jgi:hypothetical protein